jgi:hypothetical protein
MATTSSQALPEIKLEDVAFNITLPENFGLPGGLSLFRRGPEKYNEWAGTLSKPFFNSYDEVIDQINSEQESGAGLFGGGWDYGVVSQDVKNSIVGEGPQFLEKFGGTVTKDKLKELFVNNTDIQSPDALYAWYSDNWGQDNILYEPFFDTLMRKEATDPKQDIFGTDKFLTDNLKELRDNLGIDETTLKVATNLAASGKKTAYQSGLWATNVNELVADVGTKSLDALGKLTPEEAERFNSFAEQGEKTLADRKSAFKDLTKSSKGLATVLAPIGAVVGGPIGAFVGSTIGQYGDTGEVDLLKSALAAGGTYVGQQLFGPTPTPESVDYSLTAGGADVGGLGFQVPAGEVAGLQLAPDVVSEGLKLAAADLAPALGASVLPVNLGLGAQDYSLLGGTSPEQLATIGETGLLPGTAGEGLQLPQVPALPSMGGGQGLSVPVSGGTVTEAGFTPTGATPVLGDPNSFINDPNVLGQPVIQDISPGLSARDVFDALRGARSVYNALNPPASGQAVGGGLVDTGGGFQPTGVQFPMPAPTQIARTPLPSLGPVISPYISQERLALLSQPYQTNLLGYQPNFSLLG